MFSVLSRMPGRQSAAFFLLFFIIIQYIFQIYGQFSNCVSCFCFQYFTLFLFKFFLSAFLLVLFFKLTCTTPVLSCADFATALFPSKPVYQAVITSLCTYTSQFSVLFPLIHQKLFKFLIHLPPVFFIQILTESQFLQPCQFYKVLRGEKCACF